LRINFLESNADFFHANLINTRKNDWKNFTKFVVAF